MYRERWEAPFGHLQWILGCVGRGEVKWDGVRMACRVTRVCVCSDNDSTQKCLHSEMCLSGLFSLYHTHFNSSLSASLPSPLSRFNLLFHWAPESHYVRVPTVMETPFNTRAHTFLGSGIFHVGEMLIYFKQIHCWLENTKIPNTQALQWRATISCV